MRDQDIDPEFSWPLAFFITGLCFLAFFYVLGKLNENSPRVFLWIGVASLLMAVASTVGSLFVKPKATTRREEKDQ